MNLKDFLEFVEIKTKVASIIPFFLGTIYSIYRYDSLRTVNFFIMLVSLISFDMATTAINNYCDYKKRVCTDDEKIGIISSGKLKESTALALIAILLAIAVISGIILTIHTNLIVFFIGAASFSVGIFYTFGPVPISRMPLGEIFSGFFMGFVIVFLSIYINTFDSNIILFSYNSGMLNLSINIIEIIYIFLISISCINGIFNIMLANNICDLSKDTANDRYTLAYYIGRKNSLLLFKFMYYIIYAAIIFLIVIGVLPKIFLMSLFTFFMVDKNIKMFCSNPVKSKTFILSVMNFTIINLVQIGLMCITIIF
ncbi:MAG: 1,4-dihydroxy-2-naphthoate polyprenyltransferase [Clostridium sp.]|uniref:1,4-dihydroxy-2-naphthoate polyprenyltransferase n=1 Tax=Clostridium sp. TaxID=1506 RepID=UPI0025B93112|nr:1,4-dihydroxy-2-naphthoate polyprenyltransferase [Clostridium sp.]MCH3963764.1 1,4-dihydroxy-2-naphthoate polyprenyltransferase [Clostridium sp.]MCI1714905.1 1,4-dihydroxy-2-naphthoate polyprenyltransferase [Clostridium sp.]MCI1798906.1 1,4-dihydroxy-2-naphthoate polyprenyltransferase [Clostridium sp.]MCI1813088.1 1,4-dihydroxy-2-naphthoate polyprenyltransferase [Clostridium sp.]MCI1869978.1 1,4-dihydroxy-2-naphthoate polyprenyltransferase [Clostridium sp.]